MNFIGLMRNLLQQLPENSTYKRIHYNPASKQSKFHIGLEVRQA